MNINYRAKTNSYILTRDDGSDVELSGAEMQTIQTYLRQNGWRSEVEEWIDMESDCYDFSEMPREDFVEEVLSELEDRWQNGFSFGENTVQDATYKTAKDNGIWRD